MRQVVEAFERWRALGLPLALVTVVETQGSTYTKAGHRILMTGAGEFQGLVSGGCLEGDLAEHAREVISRGRPQLLTYDLRDGDDELWGLGIGCNGIFRVLLQPLSAEDGYEPFAAIATQLLGGRVGVTATVVESDAPEPPAGATAMIGDGAPAAWQLPAEWREHLIAGCRARTGQQRGEIMVETVEGHSARILYAPLKPLPRLLVLGAGLDAVPLIELAHRLGWRVTVVDHRPTFLGRGDLACAERSLRLVPADLAASLPLAEFSAAIVMSHHLATDRAWLRALASSPLNYIGLLGPTGRRDRLLADLGPPAESLRLRLHAPAGLSIGADSPESIALAILAELHVALTGRDSAGRAR
jgi:xanthine/CO dehydrogenase XdhC/CoxF family maturation factor